MFLFGKKKKKETPVKNPEINAHSSASAQALEEPPRVDVALPKKHLMRKSFDIPNQSMDALRELPLLKELKPQDVMIVFQQKLELCSIIFNFDDPKNQARGKEVKRQTLLELVDYVNIPQGQKIFTEEVMPNVMACVKKNIIRELPPQLDDFDPDEDEPMLDPAWSHLQIIYEFFLRFVVSTEVDVKVAKRFITQKFLLQFIELFDSEDPRERDYLKTILHRIYGKFMPHRLFIRKAIANVFYRFIYETERFRGIAELLEILGAIINGFAVPLKPEHLTFLEHTLLPLHKPHCLRLYHQHLSYCTVQYVEKDPNTAIRVLNGLIKYWPWTSSMKQLFFLNELEEVLELIGNEQQAQIQDKLFSLLRECLGSPHFQIVERTLFLWNNPSLVNSGCLSAQYAPSVLPYIYSPLYHQAHGHWNVTVGDVAQNILQMYYEIDPDVFNNCKNNFLNVEEQQKAQTEQIAQQWEELKILASCSPDFMS
jgi:serine/threonine-protein phosphatase 2A regulatory subunit B'